MLFDLFPLVVGFLGSLHCLGMCGPLVLACSLRDRDCALTASEAGFRPASPPSSPYPSAASFFCRGLWCQLAFNAGRLLSYGLLGAFAAGLFEAAEVGRLFFELRGSMTFVGGALLILLGLALMKVLPLPAFLSTFPMGSGSLLGRSIRCLFRSSSLLSRLALGLSMGLMPCCLSWAMIATAAATQSPSKGFLTMLAFGIGTVPALFLTGASATLVSMKVRFLGERAAAASVLAMGVALVLRGAGILT